MDLIKLIYSKKETIKEVYEYAGMNFPTFKKRCNNPSTFSEGQLSKIADCLDMKLSTLLKELKNGV